MNGYIQTELGGKLRGLKFNMMALELLGKYQNSTLFTDSSSLAKIFYVGLLGNCDAKQVDPDFTYEDVSDWVEELLLDGKVDVINAVSEAFMNSRAMQKLGAVPEAVEEKKRPSKKK